MPFWPSFTGVILFGGFSPLVPLVLGRSAGERARESAARCPLAACQATLWSAHCGTMAPALPEVRVLPNADAAVPLLLAEVRRSFSQRQQPLIGFASGNTYAAFLRALGTEIQSNGIAVTDFVATHLDEYIGYEPDRRGGMVHELMLRCPAFRDMLARGTFLPVPCYGAAGSMQGHEARIERAGGLALQFLGIGRNAHIGFNEPGAPFDQGFHVTDLADSTRIDAAALFAPDEPPRRAVTAGIASILAADRIVLCAFGSAKASAVAAMLQAEVAPSVPASALRNHPNTLVLLDSEAASEWTGAATAGGSQ